MKKQITAKCNYTIFTDGRVKDMNTYKEVTDPAVSAFEQNCAAVAVAEDAKEGGSGAPCGSYCRDCAYCHFADQRINNAIRVDFLVGLCFALNLWDWTTKEVVIFLVKACTEKWRCRFAKHPAVQGASFPAILSQSSHIIFSIYGLRGYPHESYMGQFFW